MLQINSTKKSRGVSLIEVLVTVVILAIGMLGLAGLQGNALRGNTSAYMRSQATFLAYDMLDRMRVNRTAAVDNQAYDVAIGSTSPTGTDALDVQEVAAWKTALTELSAGDGAIDCVPATDVCYVTVRWNDTRATGTDDEDFQWFVTSGRL
jgi:type IV pilus assembly protein PilV